MTDRKGYKSLLSEHLGDIDSSQRRIICKIKGLFIAGVAVEQSGELTSVAETELYLEFRPIDLIDIFATARGIRRELEPVVSSHQGDSKYFLLVFDSPGATGPEAADIIGLFPGL